MSRPISLYDPVLSCRADQELVCHDAGVTHKMNLAQLRTFIQGTGGTLTAADILTGVTDFFAAPGIGCVSHACPPGCGQDARAPWGKHTTFLYECAFLVAFLP